MPEYPSVKKENIWEKQARGVGPLAKVPKKDKKEGSLVKKIASLAGAIRKLKSKFTRKKESLKF